MKFMKTIPLTRGFKTIVDDEDFELLSQYNWCILSGRRKKYYACAFINGKKTLLHRFLLNVPTGKVTDHINGNSLDNRKLNLRITDNINNCWNRNSPKLKKRKTSKYKGVYYAKQRRGKKWEACITKNFKKSRIGLFNTEIEAAEAYNKKALELFGEFAKLNEIKK